jgi:hypothetical protein
MPYTKRASKRKHPKKAVPVVGVVGVSLSLAGGASAATSVPAAHAASWDTSVPQITLSEEEIADVSLGTFYVFDKENAGTPRLGEQFAQRGGGAGAGGGGKAGGGGCQGARGGGVGGGCQATGGGGCQATRGGGCQATRGGGVVGGGCRGCRGGGRGCGCLIGGGCGGCGCGGCGCCLSWGVCRIC